MLSLTASQMQIVATSARSINYAAPNCILNATSLHLNPSLHSFHKPHHSTFNFPSFVSTPTLLPSTRLLCKPPFGKHVREDYLVKKLTAKEVEELVRGERNVPLVIDFYATWCGPCILMAQELEMLAVEYENNALIVKIDTDDEYEFARDMQDIQSGRIIGRGTECGGLYYIDEVTHQGTAMHVRGTMDQQVWMWHQRLGHPSPGCADSQHCISLVQIQTKMQFEQKG